MIILIAIIITKLWNKISYFLHSHYTYSKVFFVILYFSEQGLFIIATFLFKEQSSFYPIIVSLFALIVLTTVTIQEIMMEAINTNNQNNLHKHTKDFAEQRFKFRQNYEDKIFDLKGYIIYLENRLSLVENKRKRSKK